jgi:hypothetical protein
MHIPLTSPSGIHGIGLSFFIVSADNQHWLWQQPRCRLKTLHIICFFILFCLNSFKYGGRITNYQRKIATFAISFNKS